MREHALSIMVVAVEPVDFVALTVVVDYLELGWALMIVSEMLVVDFKETLFVYGNAIDHLPDIEVEEEVVEELMDELYCSHLIALR